MTEDPAPFDLDGAFALSLDGLFVVHAGANGAILRASDSWRTLVGDVGHLSDCIVMPLWGRWPEGKVHVTVRDRYGDHQGLLGELRPHDDQWVLLATVDPAMLEKAQQLAALTSSLDVLHREESLQRSELMQAHDDFQSLVFGLTHDLRGSLLGSELLLEQLADGSFPAAKDALLARTHHMMRMADLMMEYARAGAAEPQFERVDMGVVVDRLCERFSSRIAAGDTIQSTGLPQLYGDAAMLEQVLHNLVENAIKYRRDAPLEIRLGGEAASGRQPARIWVEDNGSGVTAEQALTMFEPFRKHSDRSGVGLGLSVCKRIIEKHGGTIMAEPLELGCRVSFTVARRPRAGPTLD